MATGNIESWAGEITEIGAAYPFVGTETILFLAGLIFWIWWHVWQLKAENNELKEQVEKFGNPTKMREILDSQQSSDNN